MKRIYLRAIDRYINQEMNPRERERFEDEMEKNKGLAEAYRRVKEIYATLGDTDSLKLRQQLDKIIRENRSGKQKRFPDPGHTFFWLAALLVVMVGLSFITMLIVSNQPWNYKEGNHLSFRLFKKDDLALNPAYADLMKYQIRSDGFEMVHPKDSTIYTTRSDIILTWRSDLGFPIVLDVLNQYGKLVYTSNRPVTSPYLLQHRLPRGAYIIRFRSEERAVYYGVIFVE